jgi:beta-N-acetylhexosaminidase
VGTPYDIAYFTQAPTFITSYGYQPVSLHPLVKVLFGQLAPQGKLPVTIPLYPFGYGLGHP